MDVRVRARDLRRDVDPRRHGRLPTSVYWLTGFVPGAPGEPALPTAARRERRPSEVVARRNRDVEELVADQLAVGDGLAAARDDALADAEARRRARRAASTPARAAPDTRPPLRRGSACRRSDAWLPTVPPWFGVTLVSFAIILIWLMSMFSSSAAIISRPVVEPWPELDLPELHRRGVVGVDREPRVDLLRVVRAAKLS